jgi:hypothetical protein
VRNKNFQQLVLGRNIKNSLFPIFSDYPIPTLSWDKFASSLQMPSGDPMLFTHTHKKNNWTIMVIGSRFPWACLACRIQARAGLACYMQQAFVCLPAIGRPGLIQQVIGYLHIVNWPTFIPLCMLGPAHSIAPGEPGPRETLAHRVFGEPGSGPLSASTESGSIHWSGNQTTRPCMPPAWRACVQGTNRTGWCSNNWFFRGTNFSELVGWIFFPLITFALRCILHYSLHLTIQQFFIDLFSPFETDMLST